MSLIKKFEKILKKGIDILKICGIIIASAWSDGRRIVVMAIVRKVRASQSRVLANGKSRQLEGKCNRK